MTAAIDAVFTTYPGSPDARMRGTKARIAVDHTPQVDVDHAVPTRESGSSHELPERHDAAALLTATLSVPTCARPRRQRRRLPVALRMR